LIVPTLIIVRAYAGNQRPGYTGGFIVGLTRIPSPPKLISWFLINQQCFDIHFGEH